MSETQGEFTLVFDCCGHSIRDDGSGRLDINGREIGTGWVSVRIYAETSGAVYYVDQDGFYLEYWENFDEQDTEHMDGPEWDSTDEQIIYCPACGTEQWPVVVWDEDQDEDDESPSTFKTEVSDLPPASEGDALADLFADLVKKSGA